MQEIHHFFHSLFSLTLDFRVRLFNILALGGTVISLIMAFLSLGTGSWGNVLINLALVAVSGGLFLYSYYSEKISAMLSDHHCHDFSDRFSGDVFYQRRISWRYAGLLRVCHYFYRADAGKKTRSDRFSAGDCPIYRTVSGCIPFPGHFVTPFATEADRLADILLAFVSVSIVCGSVLYFHLKEYNQQQLLLEEQNLRLRSLDNAKSTFLTTVAHEIKNPLSSIPPSSLRKSLWISLLCRKISAPLNSR